MEPPVRKPNRLGYYDYSTPGAYFVTICTQNRKCTLSCIQAPAVGDGFPVPSEPIILKGPGKIAKRYILQIPKKYPNVRVDQYVIMPNHIHLLLSLTWGSGTGNPSPTLGNVIGWFKYQVTRDINMYCGTPGVRFFQRSYYDHVIREERGYLRIWAYIDGNPARWREDCFYTEDTRDVEDAVPYECEEYQ